MSENASTKQLITELERIHTLWEQQEEAESKILEISLRYDKKVGADKAQLKQKLSNFQKKQKSALPSLPSLSFTPPPSPPKMPEIEKPFKSIVLSALSGLLSLILSILAILYMGVWGENKAEWMIGIILPLLFVSIGYWFIVGSENITEIADWLKADKKRRQEIADWSAGFNQLETAQKRSAFVSEFSAFDTAFLNMTSVCDQELMEQSRIFEELKKQHLAAFLEEIAVIQRQRLQICKELDGVTLIPLSLLHMAEKIALALKNMRASNLQDAINIALDDERKRQEELQRQMEAERRLELLEQQAEEERMHHLRMESAARENARALQDQTRIMEQQAREAAQERDRQRQQQFRDAADKCRSCKRVGCPASARAHSLTCSAFVPKTPRGY